jgi:hypothetical protein
MDYPPGGGDYPIQGFQAIEIDNWVVREVLFRTQGTEHGAQGMGDGERLSPVPLAVAVVKQPVGCPLLSACYHWR